MQLLLYQVLCLINNRKTLQWQTVCSDIKLIDILMSSQSAKLTSTGNMFSVIDSDVSSLSTVNNTEENVNSKEKMRCCSICGDVQVWYIKVNQKFNAKHYYYYSCTKHILPHWPVEHQRPLKNSMFPHFHNQLTWQGRQRHIQCVVTPQSVDISDIGRRQTTD